MVRQSRRSKRNRRNKRGGNYPEAPIAQQTDYSQQIPAPISQPEQQIPAPIPQPEQQIAPAPIPQPEQQIAPAPIPQPEQNSGSGFFGSVTNFFNSKKSTDATGVPGAPEAEKPWYQVWGGRRRTRSRKGRKSRKSRKSRCYKK
jgi:hypothetical protein